MTKITKISIMGLSIFWGFLFGQILTNGFNKDTFSVIIFVFIIAFIGGLTYKVINND